MTSTSERLRLMCCVRFSSNMKTLTAIQQEAIKKLCPHCEVGKLREVEGVDNEDEETGTRENYLWCDSCLLSMDGDGGYTY